MLTVSLRFSEKFAPPEGTIYSHQILLNKHGFVWYGKLGLPLAEKTVSIIMKDEDPRILLVQSGGQKRYWAHVSKIQRAMPEPCYYPSYYGDKASIMKTWFKVSCFEEAPKGIMGECYIHSSGTPLSIASKHSMSPYFIIEYIAK